MKYSKNIWSLLIQKKHAVCAALAAAVLVMIQAACTVLEVIVLQRFLDGFSAAVLCLGQSLNCIAVLAAIYAFRYFRTPLLNWLNGSITLQLRESLEHLIIKKAARISLVSLEHADHQALLRRVQDVPEKRYANGLFAILEIMGGMLQTAGVLFLLAGRVPCFLTVILLLLGMMVVVFRIIGKNRVKLYQARQEIGRRGDYLSGILFDRTLAQEKKLFGYTHYIQKNESYYRQRAVLLFDEPTAAIDPLEEMELYEKLNELAGEKTVILVTHRLGAVRNADKIIVMENGSITEMGNFDELIRLKGYFNNIWTEQTKWYHI